MTSDAPVSRRARRRGRGRFVLADLARLLATWLVSTLLLWLADALLPDLEASSLGSLAAVAAVSGVVGSLVRPLLVEVGVRLGWLTVLPLAFCAQGVVLHVAILLVPGITATWPAAFWASWVSAAGATIAAYVLTAGTDESLTTALARRGRPVRPTDPEVDGLVVVQLDGVPFPVLRWAVQAGGVPTIRRWVTTGAYQLREWTPQLPCTTPASQLGLLHGTVAGIPGFRWYDRELGRVLVANHPGDARIIEERASDGRGLLCEDGVSISNLFSGDADNALLTMSRASPRVGSAQTRRALAWFMLTPTGFSRSLTRTLGQVAKERWQARAQVRHDLVPRVPRSWTFALLRSVTNGLLRDLNTALIAEEMQAGRKVIYVDYVDYDEVAHHAGLFRHESLDALEGLDRVLGNLELLAAHAARRYRLVVVSDHGQAQGQPFADRHGVDLPTLCTRLMGEDVHDFEETDEGWGRAHALVQDIGEEGVAGRLTAPARRRVEREGEDRDGSRAPDRPTTRPVVLGSGNLGLFYVPGPTRQSLDALTARWPRLLPGLSKHPGVGFIAGIDDHGVPWAHGDGGRVDLASGAVTGTDPLARFGEHARRVLLRAVLDPRAPDLYVNSSVDDHTLDIAAFEELVGAHGGLGGWQDSAVLLAPQDLAGSVPERVEGAEQLHQVLLGFLRQSGQRLESGPPHPAVPGGEGRLGGEV
ncbi:alkaline phosphatase family protein [Nocardioides sp. zg-1228]|uniref:alkaline phosphatase family protein n=1 Tax=Nocardioides sp. zg-1228 TaxID=2763008 RepID=UPI00164247BC|nr:alkaline phosphatase family protein [Nocardioides sp. zg-1228]MBC2934357.1 alkaline phosphatase family protein [Nocardioides sp. zg-1228]QSF59133.1 alkaline phosphatase family protein [Nocardioides sp. zg-1228]